MTDANPAGGAPAQGSGQPPAGGTVTLPADGGQTPPPAQSTPPAAKAWYEEAGFATEEIGVIQNKGWKTPKDMFASYAELEKFRGADEKSLVMLPKEQTPEAMRKVYEKLGMPTKPEDYKLEAPKDLQNAVAPTPDEEAFLRNAMHQAGVPQSMAQDVFGNLVKLATESSQKAQAAEAAFQQAEMAKLKTEWGAAWNERLELSTRAAKAAGLDADMMVLLDPQKGSAAMLKAFAKIGEMVGQSDKFVTGQNTDSFYGKTQAQLEADLKAINAEIGADPKLFAQVKARQGTHYQKREAILAKLASMDGAST